jgi:hypothetical protein
MGNLSPLDPLPSLVETKPPSLHLCPSAAGDTFYLLYSIYIIYILHRLALIHASYLQYTFVNPRIKNGVVTHEWLRNRGNALMASVIKELMEQPWIHHLNPLLTIQ